MSASGDRVVTRGDNNLLPDSSTIGPENVLGRVVYICRKGKTINIPGGWQGMARIVPHRASMGLRRYLTALAIIPYHALARSGICRIWLPQGMRTHVTSYMGTDGPELRVMMGERLVGVWCPGYPEWRITPPYKLFLDEKALPPVPKCNRACNIKGASDDGRSDHGPGK
jgi:hypothetical protein